MILGIKLPMIIRTTGRVEAQRRPHTGRCTIFMFHSRLIQQVFIWHQIFQVLEVRRWRPDTQPALTELGKRN